MQDINAWNKFLEEYRKKEKEKKAIKEAEAEQKKIVSDNNKTINKKKEAL